MDDSIWHNLYNLRLEALNIAEDDVMSFLTRHAATLKRLQLGVYKNQNLPQRVANMQNIHHFRYGTIRGLLTRMRDQMRLKKLNMRGDVMEEINPLTPYKYGVGLYDMTGCELQMPFKLRRRP